jgi:hypothetical protein
MVMKMASGDNSPLRQSAGKSSRTPRDGFDDGGGVGVLCGNWLSVLGIFRFGEYMGERARSVEPQGAHTIPRRRPGVGRA